MNPTLNAWTRRAGLLAALLLVDPARAAEVQKAGGPGEWFVRYTTARTLGMGGAFVATADDPLGILWNPAGLSAMDQNEVRFENARLFEDTHINAIGLAVPGSRLPSFGVTMVSLGSGGFERTNEMNDPLGTFSNGETAYLLTASRAFSTRFAIGTNIKVVQQTVEDFNAGGFGVDLGGWYVVNPNVRVGASVANLGGPKLTLRTVEENWPRHLRAGVAAHVFGGRGLVAAQVDHSEGLGARFHAGGEYWIQPTVALRLGVDQTAGTGGFSFRFAPRYQLDYGVSDEAPGMTHRVGLSYRFGGFFASSKAEPAVFSPTGEHAVTKILLNARTKADAQSWSLDIVNKADEVVRRFGGNGQAPSHIQWDGKDETGLPLADGTYRYHLVVNDREGRQIVGPVRVVEISTTGPQGTVPVDPVQGTMQPTTPPPPQEPQSATPPPPPQEPKPTPPPQEQK